MARDNSCIPIGDKGSVAKGIEFTNFNKMLKSNVIEFLNIYFTFTYLRVAANNVVDIVLVACIECNRIVLDNFISIAYRFG
jgi:hypothetical protein